MYSKEKEIIDDLSIDRKATIWAILNCYRTPKELKHLKKEIKILSKQSVKDYDDKSVVSQLMDYIEESVPHKKRSYAWWVLQKLKIKEHSEWFDKQYGKETQ